MNPYLNFWFERVHQSEGRDVGAAVLELLEVGEVEVEVGDQIIMVGGHHADRLGLHEDTHHVLHVAIEDDVDFSRLLDFSQNTSLKIRFGQASHQISPYLFSSLFWKLSFLMMILTSALVMEVMSSWSLMRP